MSQSEEVSDAAGKDRRTKAKLRFLPTRRGKLSVLELEADAQHPMTVQLGRLLEQLGLGVVHHERVRRQRRVLQRLYVSETNGSSLDEERRLQLQTALLSELAR